MASRATGSELRSEAPNARSAARFSPCAGVSTARSLAHKAATTAATSAKGVSRPHFVRGRRVHDQDRGQAIDRRPRWPRLMMTTWAAIGRAGADGNFLFLEAVPVRSLRRWRSNPVSAHAHRIACWMEFTFGKQKPRRRDAKSEGTRRVVAWLRDRSKVPEAAALIEELGGPELATMTAA